MARRWGTHRMSALPPPVFIKFTIDDETSPLQCPRCKCDYVHCLQDQILVSPPVDEAADPPRRNAYLVIPCFCESCGDVRDGPKGLEPVPGFEIYLQFQKGQTFLWAELVDPVGETGASS
jgi:hypothetical protein